MLTFDLSNNCDINIVFDRVLTMEITGNIFDAIGEIKNSFQLYPFEDAVIIDANTKKKLITVKNT